ncbi:non-ribosomal peptide synthetase, partial [Pseudoalteromonas luteoviolacea]
TLNDEEFVTQLQAELTRVLPSYMLPHTVTVIAQWPMTVNGKVDQKALKALRGEEVVKERIAPTTQNEQILVDICSKLLGIPEQEISLGSNFFELGGHSLLLLNIVSLLNEKGLHLDVSNAYQSNTLKELAAYLIQQEVTSENDGEFADLLAFSKLTDADLPTIFDLVPGGKDNIQDIYPLAPLQRGIFFVHQTMEKQDPYVTVTALKCGSMVQAEQLKQRLQQVVDRHDALRTAILWRGVAEPVQVVLKHAEVPTLTTVITGDESNAFNINQHIESDAHFINLEQAPLIELQIIDVPRNSQTYIVVKCHHIIADNVSMEHIFSELRAIEMAQTLETPRTYKHFLKEVLKKEKVNDVDQFFTQLLGDVDEPSLPFELSNTLLAGGATREEARDLRADLAVSIKAVAQKYKVSPAALFHLAWAIVIAKCSAKNDVVFGTVMSGRLSGDSRNHNMVGMMINMLPLRANLTGSVAEALEQVSNSLRELIPFEQVSLAKAQSFSGLPNSTALFSATLNYRHSNSAGSEVNNQVPSEYEFVYGYERTNYPFTLSVTDYDNGSAFNLNFQIEQHVDAKRIAGYMEEAIDKLLDALQSNPAQDVRTINVLSNKEVEEQLFTLNATDTDIDTKVCIHELFERQVIANGDKVALEFEGQQLTYKQLNARANLLAHELIKRYAVCPDTRVGIFCERSLEMVISILAVLKAGGAYVPLEPEYPTSRLQTILDDADVALILTHTPVAEKLAEVHVRHISVDDVLALHHESLTNFSEQNICPAAIGLNSSHLAYVIYTSGSTGKPKGVMNEHRALHNKIQWMSGRYGLKSSDKVLQKTPYSFDVSLWEFMLPLCYGASLVVAKPNGHKEPDYLCDVINEHEITKIHFVPSMLNIMMEFGGLSACRSIEQIFCSGEAMPAGLIKAVQAQMPNVQLHNLYGPTEAAIHVSAWDCQNFYGGNEDTPIGKPIDNTQLLILDEQMNLLPLGAVGELYIGGYGVSRGYLNQPELTSESFVTSPFSGLTGFASKPLYKTGDLACINSAGEVVYKGRRDFQVKLNGLRIELGEIETALMSAESIHSVHVHTVDKQGKSELVAYFKTHDNNPVDVDSFVAEQLPTLQTKLPQWMIPRLYAQVFEWPVTSSGKLDRKALPQVHRAQQQAAVEAPESELEISMAVIWAQLLELDVSLIGRASSLFELGGNSLHFIRLPALIEQSFGVHISSKECFEAQQLKALCEVVALKLVHNDLTSDLDIAEQEGDIEEFEF